MLDNILTKKIMPQARSRLIHLVSLKEDWNQFDNNEDGYVIEYLLKTKSGGEFVRRKP